MKRDVQFYYWIVCIPAFRKILWLYLLSNLRTTFINISRKGSWEKQNKTKTGIIYHIYQSSLWAEKWVNGDFRVKDLRMLWIRVQRAGSSEIRVSELPSCRSQNFYTESLNEDKTL